MRYMTCRLRDSETRIVLDLQKVVSAEEYKPEGASLRSYTKVFMIDSREYLLTHGFEEVCKALQFLERGL